MIENILIGLSFIIGLIVSRLIFLLLRINMSTSKYSNTKRASPMNTIICIGSGGHTTEMIKLLENINPTKYTPRFYIMANTDIVSEEKIVSFEKKLTSSSDTTSQYEIVKIPRSRIVNQSYFTSVFTTLNSILYCIPIVLNIKPNLILCNGPGTCIPICLIAFILKIFFICDTRIVFIESICRVKSLSLTGKILNYFADNIVVQWEELRSVCKRADYIGQLF